MHADRITAAETGEVMEDMPGGVSEFAVETEVPAEPTYAATLQDRLLSFLVQFLQVSLSLFVSPWCGGIRRRVFAACAMIYGPW